MRACAHLLWLCAAGILGCWGEIQDDQTLDASDGRTPNVPGRFFALSGWGQGPIVPGSVLMFDVAALPSEAGVPPSVLNDPIPTTDYDIALVGDRLYAAHGELDFFENIDATPTGPNLLDSRAQVYKLAYAEKTDALYARGWSFNSTMDLTAYVKRYDNAHATPATPAAMLQIDPNLPSSGDFVAGDDDRVYMLDLYAYRSDLVAIENASKLSTSTPRLMILPQDDFIRARMAIDSKRLWLGGATSKGPEVRGYSLVSFGPDALPILPDVSSIGNSISAIEVRNDTLFVAAEGTVLVFDHAGTLQSGAAPLYRMTTGQPYAYTSLRFVEARGVLLEGAVHQLIDFVAPAPTPTRYVVSPFVEGGSQKLPVGFPRLLAH